ncbi:MULTISPECIES: DUF7260 family protein [Halobacteriales]|uniref:DUF7260 family protein n=1 Tax=Halobacterium salinarum TaxID=2242 RepID=UPI003EB7325C
MTSVPTQRGGGQYRIEGGKIDLIPWEIRAWIVDANEISLTGVGFDSLQQRHETVASYRDLCEDVARTRQQFRRGTTNNGLTPASAILIQRRNPVLHVSDECSDWSEPRNEQAGANRVNSVWQFTDYTTDDSLELFHHINNFYTFVNINTYGNCRVSTSCRRETRRGR